MDLFSSVKATIMVSLAERFHDEIPAHKGVEGLDNVVGSLTEKIVFLMENKISIKTCPNCGSVFATLKSSQQFCCRECLKESGHNQSELDPAIKCYKKAYKAMSARYSRGRITKTALDNWRTEARSALRMLHDGEVSYEAFRKRITRGIRRWERVAGL